MKLENFKSLLKVLKDSLLINSPTDIYKLKDDNLYDILNKVSLQPFSSEAKDILETKIKQIFKAEQAYTINDIIPDEYKAATDSDIPKINNDFFYDLKINSNKYAKEMTDTLLENDKTSQKGRDEGYKQIEELEEQIKKRNKQLKLLKKERKEKFKKNKR